MHHSKVLCSSLTGYFTKAQQGRVEHDSELEIHQSQEPQCWGPALLWQVLVNTLFPATSQSPKKECAVASASLASWWSFRAAHHQVSLLRRAWDLHVTLSLHSCLTKPTSFHTSGSCFLSWGVLESALDEELETVSQVTSCFCGLFLTVTWWIRWGRNFRRTFGDEKNGSSKKKPTVAKVTQENMGRVGTENRLLCFRKRHGHINLSKHGKSTQVFWQGPGKLFLRMSVGFMAQSSRLRTQAGGLYLQANHRFLFPGKMAGKLDPRHIQRYHCFQSLCKGGKVIFLLPSRFLVKTD